MNYGNVYEVEFQRPQGGTFGQGIPPVRVIAFAVAEAATKVMSAGYVEPVTSVKLVLSGVYF